ncbi:hypothetical protein M3Y97_00194700 [Aphelenchoides bicaudatus]|nr:hypothetical protein M3Y97_00194700 [Aphelenchoides bicaudatus]
MAGDVGRKKAIWLVALFAFLALSGVNGQSKEQDRITSLPGLAFTPMAIYKSTTRQQIFITGNPLEHFIQ